MSDEAALLRAIYAEPDEDTPRLVYADWLDENGQPERAEFIRAQVQIAAWEGMHDAERLRLSNRYHELLKVHEQTWLAEFGPFGPQKILLDFDRGFVNELAVHNGTPTDLEIIRRIPTLRRLEIGCCSLTPEVVRDIASLQGLEYLHISETPFEAGWLSELDSVPCWTVLRFPGYDDLREALTAFQERRISRVKELSLDERRCAAIRFIRAIEGNDRVGAFRPTRSVTHVGFQQVWVEDAELQFLTYLPELESLYILDSYVTSAGLCHLSNLQRLKSVDLSKLYVNSITPLTHCTSLQSLELRSMYSEIEDDGTEGLERLTNLRHLVLWDGDPFGDATIHRIGKLRELQTLEIDLDLEDETSLAALLSLTKLESLTLNEHKYIGGELQRFLERLRQQ